MLVLRDISLVHLYVVCVWPARLAVVTAHAFTRLFSSPKYYPLARFMHRIAALTLMEMMYTFLPRLPAALAFSR